MIGVIWMAIMREIGMTRSYCFFVVLFFPSFVLLGCSNFLLDHSTKQTHDPSSTKTFYEECKQDVENLSLSQDFKNGECSKKLSLFFLGYTYGEVNGGSVNSSEKAYEDVSKAYKMNKHFYDCAEKQGYLVVLVET